jgi:hypothetical protein
MAWRGGLGTTDKLGTTESSTGALTYLIPAEGLRLGSLALSLSLEVDSGTIDFLTAFSGQTQGIPRCLHPSQRGLRSLHFLRRDLPNHPLSVTEKRRGRDGSWDSHVKHPVFVRSRGGGRGRRSDLWMMGLLCSIGEAATTQSSRVNELGAVRVRGLSISSRARYVHRSSWITTTWCWIR